MRLCTLKRKLGHHSSSLRRKVSLRNLSVMRIGGKNPNFLLYSVSPDDLLLRMGEYDLGSTDEPQGHVDRKVQIVASHPKFDPKTFEYDLALLRFYEPVEFKPNVIPICIPDEDEELVGETAWVTGWGRLYEGKIIEKERF